MLIDPHRRRIDYLRVSVTDRCDLRCFYCLPKGFKGFCGREERLTAGEVATVVGAFAGLGVRRVRLTGGEPLMRPDIVEICQRITAFPGIEELSISTNATRLAELAPALKRAGVARVNVSLDSLSPARFARITGGGELDTVLEGLEAARAAGLAPVKVNTVVMGGINDDEAEALVAFCAERGFTLRFIETMPMGSTGAAAAARFVDLRSLRRRLEARYELVPDVFPGAGPARYFRVAGSESRIGFITPISQHFCETCNRMRVGADGTLYSCLGQEHSTPLRPLLAAGQAALAEAIRRAVALKPARHEFGGQPAVARFMATTGG